MAYTQRIPRPVAESWDWQLRAACRGMDVSAFFHPTGERGARWRRREERAKRVCAGCPVRAECLEHALMAEEPFGLWGGMGENDRWALVRQRRDARRRSRLAVPAESFVADAMTSRPTDQHPDGDRDAAGNGVGA